MIKILPNELPLAGYEITMNDDCTLETISLTLFASGCVRHCNGCQNPELQIMDEKTIISIDQVKQIIKYKQVLIESVAFSGGDFIPLYSEQLKELICFCKNNTLKTIIYTGETYSNIDEWFKENADIIVSEPYDGDMKQGGFPASTNQKVYINGKEVDAMKLQINNIGV